MKMRNAIRFAVIAALAVGCSTEKKSEEAANSVPAPTTSSSAALDESTPPSLLLVEPIGSDGAHLGELAQLYKVQGEIPEGISKEELHAKLKTAERVEVGDLSDNTNSDDLDSSSTDSFFGFKKYWHKYKYGYRNGCGMNSCYNNYVPTCAVVRPTCYSGNCGGASSYNHHYRKRVSFNYSYSSDEGSSYNAFNPGYYSQSALEANLGNYCGGMAVTSSQCVSNWGQNVGGVQYPQIGGYNVNAYSVPQQEIAPIQEGGWN